MGVRHADLAATASPAETGDLIEADDYNEDHLIDLPGGSQAPLSLSVVEAEWFGLVPDDPSAAAANSAAIAAMLTLLAADAFVPAAGYQGLATVRFGNHKYYFSEPIDIKQGTIRFEGTASGFPNAIGTVFKFPAGSDGLYAQYFESAGEDGGAVTAHEQSAGCVFQGIIFQGGFNAASPNEGEHHGLVIRSVAGFNDCQVIDWQGEGVKAYAGALSLTNVGNINLARFINVTVQRCRYGYDFAGADAGAWLISGGSIDSNRAAGIKGVDNASLLGTVDVVHFDVNGASGLATIPPTMAWRAGNVFGVLWGRETQCSTNAPPATAVDDANWYWIGAAGSASVTYPAHVNGTVYRAGGPAIITSVNAKMRFRDCYSEGGLQARAYINAPSFIDGGAMSGHRNIGTGLVWQPTNTGLSLTGSLTVSNNVGFEGAANSIGPNTITTSETNTYLRQTGDFHRLRGALYVDGVLIVQYGELTFWANGGGTTILSAVDTIFLKTGGGGYDTATSRVTIGAAGLDLLTGTFKVAGTQVLGARKTGWSADTGTAKRTANATYSGTAEVGYTQATVQALMDAVRDLSQTVKALKDDGISTGWIGA